MDSRRDAGAEHRAGGAGRGGAGSDAGDERHQDGLRQGCDQGGTGITGCVGAAARAARVRAAVARAG